jgi:hypothetical protein
MRDECIISALVLRLQFDTRSLSIQQKVRLMPMVATVRNSYFYHNILNLKRAKEMMAKTIMGKMSVQQLGTLLSFHCMMGLICQEVLETKLHGKDIHTKKTYYMICCL